MGSRFWRSFTRSALDVDDVSRQGGEGVELSRAVTRRPLPHENIEGGRDLVERGEDITLPGERAAKRFSEPMEALMASAAPPNTNEVVQPAQEVVDLVAATVQHGMEFADEIADLPDSTAVDDERQRRQRLLGGRIGRRLVQAKGRARLQLSGRILDRRRIQRGDASSRGGSSGQLSQRHWRG